MQLSPTRQILSVQRQENMADATSSDPVTQDIPLRSSRRRRNSMKVNLWIRKLHIFP